MGSKSEKAIEILFLDDGRRGTFDVLINILKPMDIPGIRIYVGVR